MGSVALTGRPQVSNCFRANKKLALSCLSGLATRTFLAMLLPCLSLGPSHRSHHIDKLSVVFVILFGALCPWRAPKCPQKAGGGFLILVGAIIIALE